MRGSIEVNVSRILCQCGKEVYAGDVGGCFAEVGLFVADCYVCAWDRDGGLICYWWWELRGDGCQQCK
jgi:hypothetical protein